MAVGKGEYVQVLSDSTMPFASKCNETAFMLHTIVGSMIQILLHNKFTYKIASFANDSKRRLQTIVNRSLVFDTLFEPQHDTTVLGILH